MTEELGSEGHQPIVTDGRGDLLQHGQRRHHELPCGVQGVARRGSAGMCPLWFVLWSSPGLPIGLPIRHGDDLGDHMLAALHQRAPVGDLLAGQPFQVPEVARVWGNGRHFGFRLLHHLQRLGFAVAVRFQEPVIGELGIRQAAQMRGHETAIPVGGSNPRRLARIARVGSNDRLDVVVQYLLDYLAVLAGDAALKQQIAQFSFGLANVRKCLFPAQRAARCLRIAT